MKRAIVTGCSRGIGRAVTEMLLAEGWAILGISRTDPEIEREHFGWHESDLGRATDPTMEGWRWNTRSIDALIHCAGIRGPFGPFLENDEGEWVQTITTNLIGTYRVVRAALPLLMESDDGRILLFSGGGAFSPEPGYSAYAATKGATIALMETLAEELSNTSVTVNAIAPGFVATDIHKGTPHEHRRAAPDALENVVACVRHLLSPQAQGLTGRTISAAWDDWASIDQVTIDSVMESTMGMRDRHKIHCVRSRIPFRRFAKI